MRTPGFPRFVVPVPSVARSTVPRVVSFAVMTTSSLGVHIDVCGALDDDLFIDVGVLAFTLEGSGREPYVLQLGVAYLSLDLLHVKGTVNQFEVLEQRMSADQAFDIERGRRHDHELAVQVGRGETDNEKLLEVVLDLLPSLRVL